MIEPRRVPLLSLPEKDKVKNSEDFGPTIRFNIKLELPIESISSEYSYIDLNEGNSNNNDDKYANETPFEREEREEMEKLQKIAEGFNSKYGGSTQNLKKRNIRDLVDRGEGYCEDSFVDNSEAYDEVIPWCMDTKHGGFYINEGILDFIENEESNHEEEEPKKKKKKLDDNQDITKKKSKEHKKPKLKKKLISDAEDSDKNDEDAKKTLTSPPLKSNSMPAPHHPDKSVPVVIEKIDQSMVVEEEVGGLDESFNFEEPSEDPTVTQLIGELTNEILQKVAQARPLQSPSATGDNQVTQLFTSSLVESLTRLHTLCQKRKSEDKHSVFDKIASACRCQREQLYKKVKRYRMNLLVEQMNKRKEELKEAVDRVMPGLMDKYKHDLEESNKLKKESMMTKEVHVSGDSDAEDEFARNELEKAKRIMAPRRKFIWIPEIRNLLCEVVSLKMRHFDMAKIKSQTAEEHLKNFLETDVKCIWPSGWILTRALFKESKAAHVNWTGDQIKAKKATPMATQQTINKPQIPQLPQQAQQPIQQSNNQSTSTQKTINSTQNSTKPIEEPTVINIDDSDNEQSKVPNIPTSKNFNKNLFTVLKEKPGQESSKFEAKPPKMEHHPVIGHQTAKVHDSQEHEVISSIVGNNNNVSHATIFLSPQLLQKAKEAQSKNPPAPVQDSPKFPRPTTLQTADGRDTMKDPVFHGKFVNNLKQIQSSLNQSLSKVKSSSEECGSKILVEQGDQVDLTGNSPQHPTPRKRTLSQTTHVEVAQTSKVDVSPSMQSIQRIAFDVNNQTPSQRNAIWENAVFQQSQNSSQVYQQLQQQYQQFQQMQQQFMKKSPKQDKVTPTKATPNATHTNFIPVVQQQPSPNVASSTLAGPKVQHQYGVAAKTNTANEVFVKDHHQDMSRARSNDASNLQRGFPSGVPFPSNETKTNQFQKSPMKKEISITQHPSYVAFQNMSPPNKQFKQFIQKPLQGQVNQRPLKSPATPQQQQQHFNQQFFQGQKLSPDNSAQHKN